jgi:hypothetical protein
MRAGGRGSVPAVFHCLKIGRDVGIVERARGSDRGRLLLHGIAIDAHALLLLVLLLAGGRGAVASRQQFKCVDAGHACVPRRQSGTAPGQGVIV